ncbi:MAG: hypothetical protein COX82_04700 [Candidatus Magasanikbacteria bacterium CG_4_10_14_0_2_um_filter_41_10]|uniref:DUF5671 domain-containing protein n=2 Tax=Candidatus Magasanikiibacteriota TaxID=1752731 RepID=A0A2M7V243_9BACT|nr:MAG: hypothetical protein COX82_04700 [Candidatus Magasanikbacteria bacterium CG_4_10_14_0_2_um_filter_41_10]
MSQEHDTGAKDFFLHLLSSITLYLSAIAFLMVTFQLINYLFPEVSADIWRYDYSSGVLRTGLSMLIITLPVFLGSRIFLGKMYTKEPERKAFKMRKWLMYLTLFVAAIIVIVTLIMIVNTFLSGEISSRFMLKALATIAVAALVFSYYLLDIKDGLNKLTRSIYLWSTSVVSVALIVGTFFVVGTPGEARLQRLDSERVSALQSIQYQIENYYTTNKELPESLDQLDTIAMTDSNVTDPVTGEQYGYKINQGDNYMLCATFDTNTKDTSRRDGSMMSSNDWQHPAGEYCFAKSAPLLGNDFPPEKTMVR